MQFNWKNALTVSLMACAVVGGFTACDDDDDDNNNSKTLSVNEIALAAINKNFVETTVIPTYAKLADASEALLDDVEKLGKEGGLTDANIAAAGTQWKVARKYWELSEAFLFGAASGYAIDPHIDTWPFNESAFNKLMSDNKSLSDEAKDVIDECVATTQQLTGFHAVEYILFAEGATKTAAAFEADELKDVKLYFVEAAAADLYLSSVRLLAAWKGTENVSTARQELLEEAELEPEDNFGEEFINAGNAGSRWKTVQLAAVNILDGCQDIIGEVNEGKIGTAATGEDVNYIESPHAYNSITDFKDNIVSCAHALYGVGPDVEWSTDLTSSATSIMAWGLVNAASETKEVAEKLAVAIAKIEAMKAPFVLYYTDQSAKDAMEALGELDEAIDALKEKVSAAE